MVIPICIVCPRACPCIAHPFILSQARPAIPVEWTHARERLPVEVLFIEYPKCSTCKKAKKWLDDNGIVYTDRHIVEDSPTVDELRTWWQASGLPLRRFFNTSGMLYRELNVKAQLDAGMSDEDALALLASNGMLVKRPLFVTTSDDGSMDIRLGFKM